MLLTRLRSYQREAVDKAIQHDGFAFLLEQRTGKCLCAIAYADYFKPDIIFIVCPKKALRVWSREFEKHLKLDWDCYIRYVHFEAASTPRDDRKRYYRLATKWQKQGKRILLICDEAHRIKKRGGWHSKFVRTMGKRAKYRLALTGTPIAQGHKDAWAVFNFIQPEAFGRYEEFEQNYLVLETKQNRRTGGFYTQIIGVKNEEEFKRIFHKYSYRLTLAEARRREGFKPARIHFIREWVDLKPSTWQIYNELEDKLETTVRGTRVSTPLILTSTMKLQQIAGGFVIQDERIPGRRKKKRTIIPIGREKLIALKRRLQAWKDRKVIVCCRFTHELEAIGKLLEGMGRSWKAISGKNEFDGRFDVDVIILQSQSGEAVDLSAANVYIYYSWDFSLINFEQARFRVQSFDTEQVNYIFLIARGTVDEDMYQAVVKKKELATLICDKYRRHRERHTGKSRRHQERARQAAS